MNWRVYLAVLLLFPASNLLSNTGPVQLVSDGAWCWFGNPKAIYKNGILHFGYVRNSDGRSAMTAYDPAEGTLWTLWLSDMVQRDDHNNPGILALQDGRMLAVYAKHGNERRFYYRLSEPIHAGPVTNWGPELVYTNTPEGVTYANPHQLKEENGRVYHFMRNLNRNPTFITSDASATNWSAPKVLIRTGQGRSRPYVQYCSDGRKRIDFIYTDDHPLAFPNSLYHAYYERGAVYRTDGSLLRRIVDGPVQHDSGERGSVVYQFSPEPGEKPGEHIPGGRAWCWDLAHDASGRPVTVFSVQKTNQHGVDWGGDRLYYFYARWTGTNWQKRFIAHAGRPLYEAERDYAGGITVDPANPHVVYISSNAADPFNLNEIAQVDLRPNARYELYRGSSSDGGQTFTWIPLTRDSAVDNLRPYVPRSNPFGCGITWFAGSYHTYRSWNTGIWGLFANNPPEAPFSMPTHDLLNSVPQPD